MSALTLDQVLTGAEKLSADEQEILAELLRKRRIDAWRSEAAVEARRAARGYRSGKLKAETADVVISQLRAALTKEG